MNRSVLASALALLSSPLLAQITLTLQPNAAAGKDALLHGLVSEVNNNWGSTTQHAATAWTFQGTPGVVRAALGFNLTSIPTNATITSATLYLYAWDATNGFGQHSELSGSNAAWLKRITSSWSESTVTWNTQPTTTALNQVSVPNTSNPNQDYALDVVALVQDMVNDPAGSHGFLLQLQNESYYRLLNFCSSDHANAALRPKLVVVYEDVTAPADTCFTVRSSEGAGKDALLHGLVSEENNNWGTVNQLAASAWTFQGTPGVIRSVVDFDLSTVPAGATVTSATLSLHAWDDAGGLGQHSELSGSNDAWLQRVTEAWAENTVTWNTQPNTTAVNQLAVPGTSDPLQDYVLDVTTLVQDMVDDPLNSHGFMLRLADENYYRRLNFCSGEHGNLLLRPSLEVCYETSIGVAELSAGNGTLQIHPNPASEQARVIINAHPGTAANVIICDPTGKTVQTLTTTATEVMIDVSGFAAGWYSVRLLGDTPRMGRFLVAR